ncbi:hypothetical protein [Polyangium aurulentum]|uniref:hypothetical protein n=1 Tax=Polyangium aurulentum TaxID=2567896 RepID=UPI0010ADA705|nr:hypothetical protein [Polyangium aurulentum]UQA61408.1 hypothetical protein E8A73_013410 [Polyangium aurulentum]
MSDLTQRLPPPHKKDLADAEMWVDEQIWGHRLWDAQSPWLLFLEFLNVAEACEREGHLLVEAGDGAALRYMPHQRLYLRNILFNNEAIFRIADRAIDDASAWRDWKKSIADSAQAVPNRDFSYLENRFRSFREFASLVRMLRGSVVESDSNRRWTSRFVFPFGKNALYEDLNISPAGNATRDYINFGRTGEILYMMLCRSASATKLKSHLSAVLAGRNPWNSLVALFEPEYHEDRKYRSHSYLPYRRHPAFDVLAEDWLHIFELGLPGFDAYPYLVTLGALHVLLYQLHVASAYQPIVSKPHFICEIVAPRKTFVRELSSGNFQENDRLTQEAVERFIRTIAESDAWKQASTGPNAFGDCKRLLEDKIFWPDDPGDYDGPSDPDALLTELRRRAVQRHRQHAGNLHRTYGREFGLVSKRGTNKLRYAPNDGLLKALVLANVPQRMEFAEFLARLRERYGFIFDDRGAEQLLPADECDKKAFRANAQRLEQRLASLGLLRRLSDACAYVQNPFFSRASA